MKFGLIGYPLGHSMSGVIHKELLRIANIDASYDLMEISPDDLLDECKNLTTYDGFNVTIPHKINIIPLLDAVDDRARLFYSVNTVKIGKMATGYNTDCVGFLRALDMANIKLQGNVVLCGCGGVARTIAFETVLAGADLTLAVRKEDAHMALILVNEIADKLEKHIKFTFLDQIDGECDLLINATPVGMYPKVDNCVLPKEQVQKAKAVFDVIYNPRETMLLKYAKEANIPCSDGLAMLVWQAAVAEEIWNDIKFTNEQVMEVLDITAKEMAKK